MIDSPRLFDCLNIFVARIVYVCGHCYDENRNSYEIEEGCKFKTEPFPRSRSTRSRKTVEQVELPVVDSLQMLHPFPQNCDDNEQKQ